MIAQKCIVDKKEDFLVEKKDLRMSSEGEREGKEPYPAARPNRMRPAACSDPIVSQKGSDARHRRSEKRRPVTTYLPEA
jgi:hypothetical protein